MRDLVSPRRWLGKSVRLAQAVADKLNHLAQCPICGHRVRVLSRFCPLCGHRGPFGPIAPFVKAAQVAAILLCFIVLWLLIRYFLA